MKKLLSVLLVLMLALSVTALADAAEAVEEISFTDDLGRTVTLADYPERIVSLTPATTEILFALGVGDKVVGIDSSSDYPEEAASLEVVGDYIGPNMEAIVAAEPDLVFASTYLSEDQLMSDLDKALKG